MRFPKRIQEDKNTEEEQRSDETRRQGGKKRNEWPITWSCPIAQTRLMSERPADAVISRGFLADPLRSERQREQEDKDREKENEINIERDASRFAALKD